MRKLVIIILSALIVSLFFAVNLSAKQRGIRITAISGESLYLYKDYHALVVGVSDYNKWPDLPNAIKDAQEVASTLKRLGFKVELLLNPTSRQLNAALSNMAFTLGGEKNRAMLFYFAGHGETLELADGTELGYIIPSDCPLKRNNPIGFDDKAISMKDIEVLALKVKSKHFLMMFDSCFSGSLFNMVRAAPVDITEKSNRPVRQFITAGGAGEQVPDRSVFKIVFLDGIKGDADLNSDGYVTGSELGMHLQNEVVNYTRGGQHPQYGKINNPKLDKGDFIFALKAPSRLPSEVSVAPPPLPEPGLIEDYDKIISERKSAKKKWVQWQVRMEDDFAKAEKYDRSPDLTSKEKAGAWATFLSSYSTDNPYSTKDDELRERAQERRRHWKQFKVAYVPKKAEIMPLRDWKGIKLTYSNFFPPTHAQAVAADSWAKEVERRTNGKVKITVFSGSTLTRPRQVYDGVVTGKSDLGFSVFAYTRGRFPVMGVLDLPLGYPNGKVASRVAYEFAKIINPKEIQDVKVLYIHAHGPSLLHTTRTPVKTLEGLRGMKIRATGIGAKVVKALGGSPVAIPQSETHIALQRGVVDGTFSPIEVLKGWRQGEVIKYTTKCYSIAYTTTFFIVMNLEKWNALPASVKNVFEDISKEWVNVHGKAWDRADYEGISYSESLGNHLISLSPLESSRWHKAVEPVINAYASKTTNGDKYVRKARELIGKYSKDM